jgi:hypothetical protein
MPVIAAVEIVGDGPGRVRLVPIADYSGESIGAFVATTVSCLLDVASGIGGGSGMAEARIQGCERDPSPSLSSIGSAIPSSRPGDRRPP